MFRLFCLAVAACRAVGQLKLDRRLGAGEEKGKASRGEKQKRGSGAPHIFTSLSLDMHTVRTNARHETISRLSSDPKLQYYRKLEIY